MKQEYEGLTDSEKLKAENDFLKMKMMLERGAAFSGNENHKELPPELENEFLKSIMAFEEQHDQRELTTVFERLGRPTEFRPANDLSAKELETAWDELNELLQQNGISLDCCSPNISKKELYRFIIEELFNHEVDKVALPGWTCCFIYDEFHPDPLYENSSAAVEVCEQMLGPGQMEWMHHFKKHGLKLNDHTHLDEEEFKMIVNRFKDAYSDLRIVEIKDSFCSVAEKLSVVKGMYNILATVGNETIEMSGNWAMQFELNEEFGYWFIIDVRFNGVNF